MRKFTIQFVSQESQPEGWTVFIDLLPVVVVDSPREALDIALEMAQRDCAFHRRPTVVMVQPGDSKPAILVQEYCVTD
ncbi:MAG TPA: hypothetical protein VND91_05620 [Candidatus Saccharimonadia bacterium]|nr:hypothetical protein [Candidatus Saccharimonadia bacterium]